MQTHTGTACLWSYLAVCCPSGIATADPLLALSAPVRLVMQEAAKAARRRAQGRRIEQAFLEGADPTTAAGPPGAGQASAEDAERAYAAELAAELQVGL